jgi:outer membrane biosynthesis protein TonB
MIPGRSSSTGAYVAGVVVFAALIAGLVVWKRATDEPQPGPGATLTTATAPKNYPPPTLLPPPPPPPDAEPADAGTDAGRDAGKTNGSHVGTPGAGPCESCGRGVTTSALNAAVSGRAGMARGCYNRTLRAGAAEGSLQVSVSVGNDGSVCGASVTSDSVGDPALSSCVLAKFRAGSYPRPKQGCVVLQVPISFKVR